MIVLKCRMLARGRILANACWTISNAAVADFFPACRTLATIGTPFLDRDVPQKRLTDVVVARGNSPHHHDHAKRSADRRVHLDVDAAVISSTGNSPPDPRSCVVVDLKNDNPAGIPYDRIPGFTKQLTETVQAFIVRGLMNVCVSASRRV